LRFASRVVGNMGASVDQDLPRSSSSMSDEEEQDDTFHDLAESDPDDENIASERLAENDDVRVGGEVGSEPS